MKTLQASHLSGSIGTIVSTQASARQRHFVLLVAVVVAGGSIVLLPFVSYPLAEAPEIVPFYVAGVVLTDLITAFLLFSQFYQDRSAALLLLAAAYLFTGLIVIPHLLSFPDFSPTEGSLIGGAQSSAWLWHFWHLGFPAIALVHVLVSTRRPDWRIRSSHGGQAVALAVAVVAAIVLFLSLLATAWIEVLPILHDGRRWNNLTFQLGWAMGLITLAALALLWIPQRPRSFLHLWLSVALIAFFFDFTPNLLALQRYSVGWYLGRANGLLASGFLMAMFLWETNRLYQSLGQAARELQYTNQTLERQVSERTRHLEEAHAAVSENLNARNLLLSEVYHRVKNNLQMLDALISFEERQVGDAAAVEPLRRVRKQIAAISLVHQQLLESDRMSRVDLSTFLPALTDVLSLALGAEQRKISLVASADQIPISLETATSLGLLINELVSNAFKHAFPEGRSGTVTVRVERLTAEKVVLEVADDGCGIREDRAPRSAGSRIVETLIRQIRGEVTRTGDQGTTVRIVFPLAEQNDEQ